MFLTPNLASTQNPSFSHGESWSENPSWGSDGSDNDGDGEIDEDDEKPGIHNASEGYDVDLDGNGKFTAWSGRLRSPGAPFAQTFSLNTTAPIHPVRCDQNFLLIHKLSLKRR